MILRKWNELPEYMQNDRVRPYYDALNKKKVSLMMKRLFDIVVAIILLVILSPLIILIAIAIKIDSPGPVFFRQERVTRYGRVFRIHKFRSMCNNADKIGTLVTVGGDSRVTRVGRFVRRYRLDEIAQLVDVLKGDMTFVGVRPEVIKYVKEYNPEWYATFLLPAGVTNLACINFKDEDKLLLGCTNPDEVYVKDILPQKMEWNLKGVLDYSFWTDIKIMFMTVWAVIKK